MEAAPHSRPPAPRSWRPFIQAYVVACAFGLTILAWPTLSSLLSLVLIAAFGAVALDASVRTLQRAIGVSRYGGMLIIFGAGIITVTAGLLIAVPIVVRQLGQLAQQAPTISQRVTSSDAWEWLAEQTGLRNSAVRAAESFIGSAPATITSALASSAGTFFNGLIAVVAMLFLVGSGRNLLTMTVRLAPSLVSDRPWDVIGEIYESIGRYIVGAIVQATLAGLIIGSMLYIVDVRYAVALGLITFFWDFIPMIGSTIAGIPCVIVAYAFTGLGTAIFVAIFIIIYTQIENMVLQPRIQGGSANLPGAAIFFAVLTGGMLFGIAGAIAAVPAASVVATILRHWNEHRGVANLQPPVLFDDRGRVIRGAQASRGE